MATFGEASFRQRLWLALILMAFGIIFIFAVWWLVNAPPMHSAKGEPLALVDQATILFGAATISLVVFSLFLAVATAFGYDSLKRTVLREIEEKRLAQFEAEIRGRTLTTLGFVIGENSLDRETQTILDRDGLNDAIRNTEKGYESLQKVGGAAEFLALNNLVYYLSLTGDGLRREFILEKARLLKQAGERHSAYQLLLTYCKAILTFGDSDADFRSVRTIAEAIAANRYIPEKQQREAKKYLTSLEQIKKTVVDSGKGEDPNSPPSKNQQQ